MHNCSTEELSYEQSECLLALRLIKRINVDGIGITLSILNNIGNHTCGQTDLNNEDDHGSIDHICLLFARELKLASVSLEETKDRVCHDVLR